MATRDLNADVLIIGGGTAGFGAAIAAGRKNLNVVMLETTGKVGGVMAFCPGMPWGAAYPSNISIGGIMAELTNRLMNMIPPAAEKRSCTLENFGPEILYDHDLATLTMFEMLEEADVDVRLNTTAIEPKLKGSKIKSVSCYDRQGLFTVFPKIVIDCSGDGDISAKSGVPFTLGDARGNMMGVTLSFHMLGVNWEDAFSEEDPYFMLKAAKGISQGLLHPDLKKLYLMRGFHPATVFCNSVVIRNVDGTNPTEIARATQEGRRRCHQLAQFLKVYVPGFEDAHMANIGPTVGVRETRRLEAMYRITGQDLADRTNFSDGIVCCDNPIDDVMRAGPNMTHVAIVPSGQYYTIPFRSLIPLKITNLMFAGRLICADSTAFASVRGMPQCMAMGQATGTAAALVLETETSIQDLNLDALVTELKTQGVNGLGGMPLHLSNQEPVNVIKA